MSYKVHVELSGHEFTVDEGESILSAALCHGYTLPYGCRNGACGSCKGRLIAGSVYYPSGKREALSEEEEKEGYALFCQAVPVTELTIQVREIHTAGEVEVKRLPCRVARLERLTHDVMRVFLKFPESQRLQFLAGQYIEFMLKDGRRRAFSIANAPHDDELIELHIRHVPGGEFTDYVFHGLREKSILRVEGPLGTFFLREESNRPILLMGGGTGFAPLKGIVEHAFHAGSRRTMHLYWGVRSRRDLYLAQLPEQWAREHSNFLYTPVLSEPLPEDGWNGRCGLVHEALVRDYPELSGYEVYMSGPPAMIDAAKAAFAVAHLPDDALFYDSFEFSHDERKSVAFQ